MSIVTGKMTAREFMGLPEDPGKRRYELVHGEVVVSPSPNLDHEFVSTHLLLVLVPHVERKGLGRVIADLDTPFDPDNVRRPDIMYFSKDRMHLVGKSNLEGPPDLCIEILSPSNRHVDRGDKFELYQDCGVGFYWIIDPMLRTVEAYRLVEGKYVLSGQGKENQAVFLPPLEDLEIELSKLWRPAPPSP